MTREAELKILNDMMVDLTQYSCALRHTYAEGELKAINEGVYFVTVDGKVNPVTFIPYDDESGNNIDMRIRKRLASEFTNTYTLEFLHAERDKAIDLENKKNEKLKADYDYLSTIINKFTMFDKVELQAYANYPCITLETSWKDYEYRHCTQDKKYEMRIIDNGYRVQESYNRLEGADFETLEETLEHCNDLVSNISKLKAEAEVRLKEREIIEDRERSIRTLCWNMARDKDNAYIVKSKSTYTVYRRGTRYSMKGEGKYYNANYSKLESDMLNNKVTHYIKVNADFKRTDIDLNNTNFIAIS